MNGGRVLSTDPFEPIRDFRVLVVAAVRRAESGMPIRVLLIRVPILFVADLLHPVDGLAVEPFLNRDVRHRSGRCGAVPMLLARREPDHIAGSNLLDWPGPAPRASEAGRHNERLAQRVCMPRGPRARLERYARADDARRIGRFE